MRPDGTDVTEFCTPEPQQLAPDHRPGADCNLWFSEHTATDGAITPAGVIADFAIPTPNSFPRAIALGADGNICSGSLRRKDRKITPQAHHRVRHPDPDSGRAPCRRARRQRLFSEFNATRSGASHLPASSPSFPLPLPTRGPGDINRRPDGTCGSSSSRHHGRSSTPMATAWAASR
jgi:virginiamycin B lyase